MVHRRWFPASNMRVAALMLFVFLAAGGSAWAGTYDVKGVKVDVTADTVAQARDKALVQAQRIAFARLLERITLFEDRERLPLLAEDEVAALVQDFGVAEEKTSAVRYIARLNFRFKTDSVRALLQDYGLQFAETMSKPILVLPVYQGLGPTVLWDDPNPWRDAWVGRPLVDSLVPTILPLGDLTDITAISADQAVAGVVEPLQVLAERYEAATVLVPHAIMRIDPWQSKPLLEVRLARYGPAGQEQAHARAFKPFAGEEADALMRRAAVELTRTIEDAWKRDNLMSFGVGGVTEAIVPIRGLGDWLLVRKKLASVAVVQTVEVILLSRHQVRLALHHIGDVDQLMTALRQADLYLWADAEDWVLSPAPPAAPSPETVDPPAPSVPTTQ